jgi:hypothetical protein
MVATPTYGIDDLASDDRISWAEQAPAAHSIKKVRAILFMVPISGRVWKWRDIIRYRTAAIRR